MIRKLLALAALSLAAVSLALGCNRDHPDVVLRGVFHEFNGARESSGTKFGLERYVAEQNEFYFIIPSADAKPATDQGWANFATSYAETFRARGFEVERVGQRYLGLSSEQVVYLAPIPAAEALGVLLVPLTPKEPTTVAAAGPLFDELEATRRNH